MQKNSPEHYLFKPFFYYHNLPNWAEFSPIQRLLPLPSWASGPLRRQERREPSDAIRRPGVVTSGTSPARHPDTSAPEKTLASFASFPFLSPAPDGDESARLRLRGGRRRRQAPCVQGGKRRRRPGPLAGAACGFG